MSNISSQNTTILEHLRSGKTVTQIEAYNAFGCTRLSARIYDLRERLKNEGDKEAIDSVSIAFTARSGKQGRYCRYYLKKTRVNESNPIETKKKQEISNLNYMPWDELDIKFNFQAYDKDGWCTAYELMPYASDEENEWVPKSINFLVLPEDYKVGSAKNWGKSLIKRPHPDEQPEPDHENKEYEADQLWAAQDTPYDPS